MIELVPQQIKFSKPIKFNLKLLLNILLVTLKDQKNLMQNYKLLIPLKMDKLLLYHLCYNHLTMLMKKSKEIFSLINLTLIYGKMKKDLLLLTQKNLTQIFYLMDLLKFSSKKISSFIWDLNLNPLVLKEFTELLWPILFNLKLINSKLSMKKLSVILSNLWEIIDQSKMLDKELFIIILIMKLNVKKDIFPHSTLIKKI